MLIEDLIKHNDMIKKTIKMLSYDCVKRYKNSDVDKVV